jgi:general secretion pathway protein G
MLRQRIRDIRKNDKGFTLIELLIVIIILGVLAGIAVFSVAAFSDRGVAAACKSDVTTVESAVEAFYAKNGAYPADMAALLAGKYLKSAPSTTSGYSVTLGAGGVVTSDLDGAGAGTAACK